MSRTEPSPVESGELMFACHYCGAEVGDWCLIRVSDVSSFDYARYLHVSRYTQAYNVVHLMGWVEEEQYLRDQFYQLRRELGQLRNDANTLLPNEVRARIDKALAW